MKKSLEYLSERVECLYLSPFKMKGVCHILELHVGVTIWSSKGKLEKGLRYLIINAFCMLNLLC